MVLVRRSSQIFFLLFFVYILWSADYPLDGLFRPGIVFTADPLIMAATSVSERVILPGIALCLCLIALSLIVGRFFCGWICPLGTTIDIAGSFGRKKRLPGDRANAAIRKPKYYILGIIGIFALAGKQIAWILDPIVIMGRFVSLSLIPAVTLTLNSMFVFLIKHARLGGPVKDVYRALKQTVLGGNAYFFDNAALVALMFFVIIASAVILRRYWCRALCPLGALYALLAKAAPLCRTVEECVECGRCKSSCRMGAIKDDARYVRSECVLCMDCVYECPSHKTRFRFGRPAGHALPVKKDALGGAGASLSRKNFLLLLLGSIPFFSASGFVLPSKTLPRKVLPGEAGQVIRPPAALKEDDFVDRCVRCGNCMKICPTNALHPAMLQAGIAGIWTPHLVPEIGYCEYQCTLCGRTCPTGAIPVISRERKLTVKMGTAVIDRSLCLPWAEGKECLVCEEHCPVADKAIKLNAYAGSQAARPYVDEYLCVGCGICQNKCPVRPVRAIRVTAVTY